MNINILIIVTIDQLFKKALVLSIILSVAVLHTLARNRTIGPAEPEARRLPISAPVCHHNANKPTFDKSYGFLFFDFLHINGSLCAVSSCMCLTVG